MAQRIAHVALAVRDCDVAIGFYCSKLGFDLVEDTYQPEQDKRRAIRSRRRYRADRNVTGSPRRGGRQSRP